MQTIEQLRVIAILSYNFTPKINGHNLAFAVDMVRTQYQADVTFSLQ